MTDSALIAWSASDAAESAWTEDAARSPAITRPSRCLCGGALVQQAVGRPRTTCSPVCRRRRDNLVRMLRRRERWLAQWLGGAADHAATVQAVVALDGEIATITRTLCGESAKDNS